MALIIRRLAKNGPRISEDIYEKRSKGMDRFNKVLISRQLAGQLLIRYLRDT